MIRRGLAGSAEPLVWLLGLVAVLASYYTAQILIVHNARPVVPVVPAAPATLA